MMRRSSFVFIAFSLLFCACGASQTDTSGGGSGGHAGGVGGGAGGAGGGGGSCPLGASAATDPEHCPAAAGDGFCTHDETAATAPGDCAPGAGDGTCDTGETAATSPQDCPAVDGDGLCTHAERPDNTPQDCPAVDGDGLCTHDENAGTTPDDCPPGAGDGVCSPGETPANSPDDCAAVEGDGLCTHAEDAGTTPDDCPAVSGDDLCTHAENADTTPADCPPIDGDGFCTHLENASTTPDDCPAVDGDGFCTHLENASTTPDDCPAVNGDGYCTHTENANTRPNDCPPVDGDGYCTHTETYATTPADCPPPDYTYTGGNLAALLAVSPDLTFGELVLNATLALNQSPSTVAITAENITSSGTGAITFAPTGCGTSNAPNLVLAAAGTIVLNASIGLYGEHGDPTTDSSTCAECQGSDGGNVTITAPEVYLFAPVRAYGGGGSTNSFSTGGTLFTCGCSGGDAGNISVTASSALVIDNGSAFETFAVDGGSGGPANANCTPGDPGFSGVLALDPGSAEAQVTEQEPNAVQATADLLDFVPMEISGVIIIGDDSSSSTSPSRYIINYAGGPTNDFVEDLFKFRSSRASLADYRFSLVGTGLNNLDLFVFYQGALFAESSGAGSSHSLDLLDVALGDEIILGINRKAGTVVNQDPYTVTVTRLP